MTSETVGRSRATRQRALEQVDAHRAGESLARLVRTAVMTAADERRRGFGAALAELVEDAGLSDGDAVIGGRDVLAVLAGRAEADRLAQALISALLARGLTLAPRPPADELASSLSWLAAHTYVDALGHVDLTLGPTAAELYEELATLVREADRGRLGDGRATALAAALALVESTAPAAVRACADLRAELNDPVLVSLFDAHASAAPDRAESPAGDDGTAGSSEGDTALQGELVPAPMGPVGLVLMSVTGLIVVRYVWRFLARFVLRCRRPTEVRVAANGITLDSKLDVMGRTVRVRKVHIPRDNLARAMREAKYPRKLLYAGLLALAVGTFLGATLLIDGGRAGSPSMVALGAAVFGFGLLLDLVLSRILPARRGRHQIVFVPRLGRAFAIAIEDAAPADAALRLLARPA